MDETRTTMAKAKFIEGYLNVMKGEIQCGSRLFEWHP
jgi:hypothetical protein